MKSAIAVAAVLTLAACASTPTGRAAAVRDADARMVAGCTYLGEVSDNSVFGGAITGGIGRTNAQNKARDDAAAMGATHVVWNPQGETYGAVLMSGKAYRCGS